MINGITLYCSYFDNYVIYGGGLAYASKSGSSSRNDLKY